MALWIWVLIVLVVAALVAAAAVAVVTRKQRERTGRLKARFGPEYDRAVDVAGGRRAGEAELELRLERARELRVDAAQTGDRARCETEWAEIEQQFDEAALPALARADALVTTLMAERGYPMDSFDQRAADLSVDYPDAVGHYRRAHDAYRQADDGKGTRDDRYEALQHYRALLDALVAGGPPQPAERDQESRSGGRA